MPPRSIETAANESRQTRDSVKESRSVEKGAFLLRIPMALKLQLQNLAKSEKRSLNQQIELMLEKALTRID